MFIYPFIHFLPLIQHEGSGAAAWAEILKHLSFHSHPSAVPSRQGDTEMYQSQPCNKSSPASGSAPRPPPGETHSRHHPCKASGRHTDQLPEPPQLTSINVEVQWLYYTPLPDDWAPLSTPKGEPSHPMEKLQTLVFATSVFRSLARMAWRSALLQCLRLFVNSKLTNIVRIKLSIRNLLTGDSK